MGWINLILEISDIDHKGLADLMMEMGALSVSIVNTNPGSDTENEWFDDPTQENIIGTNSAAISVLLPKDTNIEQFIDAARDTFSLPENPKFRIEAVPDQDWVRKTQMLSHPQKIGDRLWIVPTWDSVPDPEAVNLRLDPGVAFGSGTHPTTLLCLRWLENNINGNESVLDYGCGSGVLGIAALLLGASSARGVDIDPQALTTSNENAKLNQVKFPVYLTEDEPGRGNDIVIANILANPLKDLAEKLSGFTVTGGRIVLSGILEKQSGEVLKIYEKYFHMDQPVVLEGWVLLTGSKKG